MNARRWGGPPVVLCRTRKQAPHLCVSATSHGGCLFFFFISFCETRQEGQVYTRCRVPRGVPEKGSTMVANEPRRRNTFSGVAFGWAGTRTPVASARGS